MSEELKKDENPFADSSEVGRGQTNWEIWKNLPREEKIKGAKLLFQVVISLIVLALLAAVTFSLFFQIAFHE